FLTIANSHAFTSEPRRASNPRNARSIASCTRSSASPGECDNHRANLYAALRCGNTSASNRPRLSSMDATECHPHGALSTLTYQARLTGGPLYSLTESRGLRSPVAPFPRREALVLVKGLRQGCR